MFVRAELGIFEGLECHSIIDERIAGEAGRKETEVILSALAKHAPGIPIEDLRTRLSLSYKGAFRMLHLDQKEILRISSTVHTHSDESGYHATIKTDYIIH